MLTLFGADQVEGINLANLMALPEQDHDEEPGKHLNESHCAVAPSKSNRGDPLVDIEGNRETEADSEGIQNNSRLLNVLGEALGKVVDGHRSDAQRSKRDENLGKTKNTPVEVSLKTVAKDTDANWVADQSREPKGVKTVFRLPFTMAEPGSDPERNSVTDELAVRESKTDADPVEELDFMGMLAQEQMRHGKSPLTQRVLGGGKAIASKLHRLLNPRRRNRVHGNVEAKVEQSKYTEENGDGRDSDLERDEAIVELQSS